MLKILLAEDNPNFGLVLKIELEHEGFAVDHVSDGVQAVLHFFYDPSYDVLLFDITMPELNGISAVTIIRSLYPDILPIIFSGNLTSDRKQAAYAAGAIACLSKPFDILQLKKSITDNSIKQGTEK